ncbi:glutathione transferase omega class [Trametes coccinea BRFM310]|uniref:Glutathione transferase omega class n=1 Tax=Trametes coccinea (strain BRFM310) TaxID=1353009 RepID=A0A1Y2INB8_TRAC3|nr:glutathione transferase omega class [Trametes coccinea BRFM310]
MITLYAAMDSPFPHRVLLALEEAGATYDIIWIDLMNKEEWFEKKVNPAGGKVPFLVYGGPKLHPGEAPSTDAVRISESRVILEFLADIFPAAHLLPSDPVLRARARRFITTVDEKLIKTLVGFLFLGALLENLLAILEELQAVLPPTGFVVGDWSIADACFIPALVRVRSWLEAAMGNYTLEVAKEGVKALHSPRFARLQKYYDDAKARPSTEKTWNEKEVKLSFARRMDRFYKTGIVNSELRIPVPSA